MKIDKREEGISLILLVITIIVIIILAGAVILSLSQNNPISSATEASYKSTVDSINSQLSMYVAKKLTDTNGQYDVSTMTGTLSDFIPELADYDSEFSVVCGNLAYLGLDETKKQISLDMGVISGIVTVNGTAVNRPDISYLPDATTQAIAGYDASGNPSTMVLSSAKNDTTWYDYSTTNRKWANIRTNNNSNEAYWVWIPRYAYKILYFDTAANRNAYATNGTTTGLIGYSNSKGIVGTDGVTINNNLDRLYGAIDIKFLAGTTNICAELSALPSDYIVHRAFKFGDKELPGIWVAKYEASSSNPSAANGGDNVTTLDVRVVPGVNSWRNIQTGYIQTVSMGIVSSNGSVGTTTNIDTHQMKNSEWGAVAYLTHSKYGRNAIELDRNPSSNYYTGGGEGTAFITYFAQSTTNNVYGIYDMNGGAWEYTAAFLNNGSAYLGSKGTSTYFTGNTLKPEYSKYYDVYEPSEEEKQGGTFYGSVGVKLWDSEAPYNLSEVDNNKIRKRLTDGTFAKFASTRGDGLFESSTTTSYYGKYTSGTINSSWLIDIQRSSSDGSQYTRGWNSDYNLTGYAHFPWFSRGGNYNYGSGAGLFYSYAYFGDARANSSFRPVLLTGTAL